MRAVGAGDFGKLANRTVRKMAPGESFVETEPLPAVGTVIRVAARVKAEGETSAQTPLVTLTVQASPPPPTAFTAQLEPQAVVLAWVPPPTPPPTPTPAASTSPSPSPGASPSPSASPVATPSRAAESEKFGTVDFATSCSAAAQTPFKVGVALLHSFAFDAAIKWFTEAAQIDR